MINSSYCIDIEMRFLNYEETYKNKESSTLKFSIKNSLELKDFLMWKNKESNNFENKIFNEINQIEISQYYIIFNLFFFIFKIILILWYNSNFLIIEFLFYIMEIFQLIEYEIKLGLMNNENLNFQNIIIYIKSVCFFRFWLNTIYLIIICFVAYFNWLSFYNENYLLNIILIIIMTILTYIRLNIKYNKLDLLNSLKKRIIDNDYNYFKVNEIKFYFSYLFYLLFSQIILIIFSSKFLFYFFEISMLIMLIIYIITIIIYNFKILIGNSGFSLKKLKEIKHMIKKQNTIVSIHNFRVHSFSKYIKQLNCHLVINKEDKDLLYNLKEICYSYDIKFHNFQIESIDEEINCKFSKQFRNYEDPDFNLYIG